MMAIPKDDICDYIDERMSSIAMQCIQDKSKSHEDTIHDRAKYACYKEIRNWVETNFSMD